MGVFFLSGSYFEKKTYLPTQPLVFLRVKALQGFQNIAIVLQTVTYVSKRSNVCLIIFGYSTALFCSSESVWPHFLNERGK